MGNNNVEEQDNEMYDIKIQELESLMDRYQKLSKWIEKVVEFDFNKPQAEYVELDLERI